MDIMQYEEMLKDRNCIHTHLDSKTDWSEEKFVVCEDCNEEMTEGETEYDYYRYLLSEGLAEDYAGEWDTDTGIHQPLARNTFCQYDGAPNFYD